MVAMLAFGASAYLLLYASGELRRSLAPTVSRPGHHGQRNRAGDSHPLAAAGSRLDGGRLERGDRSARGRGGADRYGFWRRVDWAAPSGGGAGGRGFLETGNRGRSVSCRGLLLASLALSATPRCNRAEGVLHRLNHAAHLPLAGAWFAGLIPFVMCLPDAATRNCSATLSMR